jgi:hypothetical protein
LKKDCKAPPKANTKEYYVQPTQLQFTNVETSLFHQQPTQSQPMQLQPTQANEPTIPSFYQPTHYQPTNEQALNMQQAAPSFYQPQANH